MRNSLLFKWTGLIILAGLCLTACGPNQTAGMSARSQPSIPVEDCKLKLTSGGSLDARCARLEVFEDQVARSGKKIGLNIAIIPAISRTPEADPLFLLSGGPGEASTASFPVYMEAFQRVHKYRDLVMVDQRGTGDSNPLICPEMEDEPVEKEDLSTEETAAQLAVCHQELGVDTRLYTTQASVEDLDQVRQALGYEKINLLGVSYGTRYAQAYLRQYPQHVRAVVLDSLNPIQWELGPHNPANAQRALEKMFARCETDPGCKKTYPNLREEYENLLAQLDKEPATVKLDHPLTGEPLTLTFDRTRFGTVLLLMSYEPETVAMLPQLLHTTYETQNFSRLASQAIQTGSALDTALSDGLYFSVLCAEDVAFYQPGEKGEFYLPDPTEKMKTLCKSWPSATVPAEFKQPVVSDLPVLLLSGEDDPITPPANAEEVAKTLSNSLTVVMPGMGHGVFGRGCAPSLVAKFIESASVKNLDVSCMQKFKPQPFFINYSATTP